MLHLCLHSSNAIYSMLSKFEQSQPALPSCMSSTSRLLPAELAHSGKCKVLGLDVLSAASTRPAAATSVLHVTASSSQCCPLLQVMLCLAYARTDLKDWDGLPKNPSICNGNKGLIGLVVQLAILLQLFGGRRSDDVLNMSYMHTKLETQPIDTDDQVNSVGPSPATMLKFTMTLNKASTVKTSNVIDCVQKLFCGLSVAVVVLLNTTHQNLMKSPPTQLLPQLHV